MDYAQFSDRVRSGENLHTEFKEWPIHPDDLAACLVAFANADGGQLLLGVSDDRRVVGVADPDVVARSVDNVATNNCEPPLTIVQETLQPAGPGGDPAVVVNIPKGDQRPYRTSRGVYYVRTSSGRRQASREELLRLFQATESLFYDETPLPRLHLSDLDLDAFHLFLEETGQSDLGLDHEQLLRNWRLLAGEHPTLAGALLFGRRPQQHLPFAQVNAFRFAGTNSSVDPLDAKELTGRLLDVLDQAQRFLRLHLRCPHEIRGFEPEAKPELPEEALRAALVNAVVHRDYTVHGPIRLFILDDRLEIHTPGRPPNTVDEAAMRAGVHVVRNPHLYSRLSDAGLVTRAGSGIRRIIRLVREATGEDIGLDVRDFEVLLTIPRRPSGSDTP